MTGITRVSLEEGNLDGRKITFSNLMGARSVPDHTLTTFTLRIIM